MRKLGAAILLYLGLVVAAPAQTKFTMPPPAGVTVMGIQVVSSCGAASGLAAGNTAFVAMDTTGVLCTSAGGGGGGGLSVVDQTAWTQGTSPFTPTGCVFNDTATLSSGQEGTVRCTTDRQFKTLDSAVLAAVQAPVPAGTNLIGKVGIDQTTPGTTNLVAVTSSQVGAGATGSAPPANSVYLGANASGATGGKLSGVIQCDNHVFKHITSATDTLAVQGVASQTIYVCSWRSRAAGVATWFLENTASANANCSSSNTQITGVATEAANTGETWGSNFWSGLKNTSGNGLCINSTGTGGVDVDIWFTQF